MTETNVIELTQPGTFSDPLTEVLRNGARTLLGQAVEAEVAAWGGRRVPSGRRGTRGTPRQHRVHPLLSSTPDGEK